MKLRKTLPHELALIESANAKIAFIVADLRTAGATKAAKAIARARKSVGGAIRHAQRCVDAERARIIATWGVKPGEARCNCRRYRGTPKGERCLLARRRHFNVECVFPTP